jgi:xanthine dehydrogenase YagT iron-sulfur-binding subunit
MRDEDPKLKQNEAPSSGVSRREFLKLGAISVAVPAVVGPTVIEVAGEEVAVHGPGKTTVTLMVNGKEYSAELEPRVTLLDALRDNFDLTGAKRVCDRGECGACTVLMDSRPVYACSVLAIDAQGHKITTIEGLTVTGLQGEAVAAPPGTEVDRYGHEIPLTRIQQAFVTNDAQQCGFCTPGFIVATHALLARTPALTEREVVKGLSGNFCRCGTYFGMRAAIAELAGKKGGA